MKKYLILPLCMMLFIGCYEQNSPVTGNLDKFEEKHEPFDHFYFQRSFPDENIDFRTMEQSMKKAHKWSQQRQQKSADGEWIQSGPVNIGGRINCIAVHPFDDDIILTGTAGGGIFKTTDGGDNWLPITDDLTHLPIAHIVFDPTEPNVLYAGTGDVNIGGTVWIGNGVYKSTDGGESWNYLGLQECRIVSKIAVNPENPQQIFVGTMGVPFETNNNRGLYRSNDGGITWEQVLFVSDDSGIIDLVMNPENPSVLYAANFNRIRTSLFSVASGEEAGIYKTTDGGDTWTELTNGLPSGPMSRIGLKLWEGNSNTLFVQYVGTDYQLEGIYKSTNSGTSFTEIPTDFLPENTLGGFGWYFGKLGVSPYNQNEITLLGVDLYTTNNSGQTWNLSAPEWWEYEVHADKHAIHYLGPDEVLLATDGGLYRTTDGFQSWEDIDRIPNTQFYRITTNPHVPGMVIGGAQDNGTSVGFIDQPEDDWVRLWGGDGFTPIVDPYDEMLCYTTTQYGNFYYLFTDFEEVWTVDYLDDGLPGGERVNWDAPFLMDPQDNTVLYTATERVYRMEFAPWGVWEPISPVLVSSDAEFYAQRNISALSVSSVDGEVIYAGTSDSKVWVTQNGGASWSEIDASLPEYYVTDIKSADYDAATVFVSFSGYRENDNTPHLYRSTDYGETWESITGDLPAMPINHVEILNALTYFIATDNGVYFTENGGVNWNRLGSNMPYIVVLDLHVDYATKNLLAGTFARSLMAYDIEELMLSTTVESKTETGDIHLYPNPTSDVLTINSGRSEIATYSIYSSAGQQIHQGSFDKSSNSTTVLSVADWSSGVYLLVGANEKGEHCCSKRFVVR